MGEQASVVLAAKEPAGAVPPPVTPKTSVPLPGRPRTLTLDRVARSHGWCMLPPFGYDPGASSAGAPCRGDAGAGQLHRVLALPGGPARVWVDTGFVLHSGKKLSARDLAAATEQLTWCLGFTDDVRGAPAAVKRMRMLRCPTVWEDLVKTLCTTNCSWSATVGMVNRLVETLGVAGTFPTPEAVIGAGEAHLKDVIRVGYRAGSLLSLAGAVADGTLDVEAWRGLPDDELLAGVLALPGFGPYSAEGMLGLLGRPRGLAVDSWIRAQLGGLTEKQVRERYLPLGKWAGAALWQDVTAHWFA